MPALEHPGSFVRHSTCSRCSSAHWFSIVSKQTHEVVHESKMRVFGYDARNNMRQGVKNCRPKSHAGQSELRKSEEDS